MNTFLKTLILTFALILSSQSHAQFLKELGNRVENRVKETTTRKVEDKAAQKTDQALEKIFNIGKSNDKSDQEDRSNDEQNSSNEEEVDVDGMLQGILGGGKEVTYESSYLFEFTAIMEITDFKSNNKEDLQSMTQSYGKQGIMTQNPEQAGQIIIDFENEAAIMVDEKNKTAQVMSLAWMKKMTGTAAGGDDADEGDFSMNKTGKTRTIHGYKCYEYIMTYDGEKSIAWFAPNVEFSYGDYLSGFTKMFGQEITEIPMDTGYVMELTNFDKKGEKVYEMKITDISKKTQKIDLNAYHVQKMF